MPSLQVCRRLLLILVCQAAFIHLWIVREGPGRKGSEVIEHYLYEGQSVVVQVVKGFRWGSKGARLTMKYSIPSRYQVYMPNRTIRVCLSV